MCFAPNNPPGAEAGFVAPPNSPPAADLATSVGGAPAGVVDGSAKAGFAGVAAAPKALGAVRLPPDEGA